MKNILVYELRPNSGQWIVLHSNVGYALNKINGRFQLASTNELADMGSRRNAIRQLKKLYPKAKYIETAGDHHRWCKGTEVYRID